MARRPDYIGRALGQAFNQFGGAYAQKLQREKMLSDLQNLLSQKDQTQATDRPVGLVGPQGVESTGFGVRESQRPIFSEQNIPQLAQLPPQVLNLLSSVTAANQPQAFNLGRGETRFQQQMTGGRPSGAPRQVAQGVPWMQTPSFDWRARVDEKGNFVTQTVPGTDDVRIVEEQYDPVTGQLTGAVRSATGGAPPAGGIGLGKGRQLVPTDKGYRVWNKVTNQWEEIPGETQYKLTPTEVKTQRAALVDNLQTIADIKTISNLGSTTGPVTGRMRQFGSKFFSDVDATRLRNKLAQLRTIIYGISGKQINEAEQEWLKNEVLPNLTQPTENFEATLDEFDKWVQRKKGNLEAEFPGMKIDQKQTPQPEVDNDPLGIFK